MQDLNSILLEGVLKKDPVLEHVEQELPVARFMLSSIARDAPELVEMEVRVNSHQGEIGEEHLEAGRRLRVVGYLRQAINGQVFIQAEHVEFKPEITKPQPAGIRRGG